APLQPEHRPARRRLSSPPGFQRRHRRFRSNPRRQRPRNRRAGEQHLNHRRRHHPLPHGLHRFRQHHRDRRHHRPHFHHREHRQRRSHAERHAHRGDRRPERVRLHDNVEVSVANRPWKQSHVPSHLPPERRRPALGEHHHPEQRRRRRRLRL